MQKLQERESRVHTFTVRKLKHTEHNVITKKNSDALSKVLQYALFLQQLKA